MSPSSTRGKKSKVTANATHFLFARRNARVAQRKVKPSERTDAKTKGKKSVLVLRGNFSGSSGIIKRNFSPLSLSGQKVLMRLGRRASLLLKQVREKRFAILFHVQRDVAVSLVINIWMRRQPDFSCAGWLPGPLLELLLEGCAHQQQPDKWHEHLRGLNLLCVYLFAHVTAHLFSGPCAWWISLMFSCMSDTPRVHSPYRPRPLFSLSLPPWYFIRRFFFFPSAHVTSPWGENLVKLSFPHGGCLTQSVLEFIIKRLKA